MKKISCILVIAGMLCLAVMVQAVLVNLDTLNVEEAKRFGAANKKKIDRVLEKLYGLGSEGPLGREVVVRTKWCKLALLAAAKAREGADITAQELQLILEDPLLQIDLRVSGNSLDFARDFTVLLRQRDREIMPGKLHADHFQAASRTGRTPPGFPAYAATIRAYFNYAQLDPAAAGVLVLKKNAAEKMFTIDLGAFK
jgi:hypothetical protein